MIVGNITDVLSGMAGIKSITGVLHKGFLFRCRETKRDEFVFFTKRLACMVIEYALSLLPFEVCGVVTMATVTLTMHSSSRMSS